jgi:hypothetical protein
MSNEKPNELAIDEKNVVLRCVADTKAEFIEKAVLQGWKQCNVCNYPICNECLEVYQGTDPDEPGHCPGSYLTFSHTLILANIATELILIEASKIQSHLPPIGILINKAFYSSQMLNSEQDRTLLDNYIRNESVFLAKQENWANMGSVIVKRNRGKYISWEKLTGL